MRAYVSMVSIIFLLFSCSRNIDSQNQKSLAQPELTQNKKLVVQTQTELRENIDTQYEEELVSKMRTKKIPEWDHTTLNPNPDGILNGEFRQLKKRIDELENILSSRHKQLSHYEESLADIEQQRKSKPGEGLTSYEEMMMSNDGRTFVKTKDNLYLSKLMESAADEKRQIEGDTIEVNKEKRKLNTVVSLAKRYNVLLKLPEDHTPNH